MTLSKVRYINQAQTCYDYVQNFNILKFVPVYVCAYYLSFGNQYFMGWSSKHNLC